MSERLEKKPSEGLPEIARPEETYKTSDPRPHFVEMDGLRGLGILSITMSHLAWWWWLTTGIGLSLPFFRVELVDPLNFFGYFQLSLFFLLSGYLLTWTEEKRKRRGAYSVLNYVKRRALRLVPAYYVAMVVVMLVWPLIAQGTIGEEIILKRTDFSFGTVVLHLAFLQGFKPSHPLGLDPVYWSLTTEIAFYAMLPLLVVKVRKLWERTTILGVLLLVSLITRVSMGSVGKPLGIDQLQQFPTTLLYLCLVGMLLRMMVEGRAETGYQPGRRQLFIASALTVVPAVLLSVLVLLIFPYLGMDYGHVLRSPAALIVEGMAILVFGSVLLGSPILKPILKLRPLVFLGEISYSLFLLHNTVLFTTDSYLRRIVRTWLPDQGELTVGATFGAFALVVVAVSVT
nr:acyltransferase [Actinomycetota bacterium]